MSPANSHLSLYSAQDIYTVYMGIDLAPSLETHQKIATNPESAILRSLTHCRCLTLQTQNLVICDLIGRVLSYRSKCMRGEIQKVRCLERTRDFEYRTWDTSFIIDWETLLWLDRQSVLEGTRERVSVYKFKHR